MCSVVVNFRKSLAFCYICISKSVRVNKQDKRDLLSIITLRKNLLNVSI